MMPNGRAALGLLAAVAVVVACAGATAQTQPAESSQTGLAPMIPAKAVAFIEHRGHTAIHDVFLDSNLGKMYSDEAMTQFVQDSRVAMGMLIVRDMFSLEDAADVEKTQQTLHELLKPFWYQPAAAFIMLPEQGREPGAGFICVTGKYEKDARAALEELMKKGLPPQGQAGTRQAFSYKKGSVTWQGVVKTAEPYKLPDDADKQAEELRGGEGSIFMVTWTSQVLYVATSLGAADAISEMLALDGKTAKGIDGNESLKLIMQKTALKDWAFRWFVDTGAFVKEGSKDESAGRMLKELGLDNVRGVGGMGGYADQVYTRLMFVDCPKPAGTLVHVFKKGGSYKPALDMLPSGATFTLAGQVDTAVVMNTVRKAMAFGEGEASPSTEPASRPASQATTNESTSQLVDEKTAAILKQVEAMLASTSGNAAFYLTDLQAIAMFGEGGMPGGVVLEVKDAAKAKAALDELVKMVREAAAGEDEEAGVTAKSTEYRKIAIQQLANAMHVAMVKDRLVIGLSETAVKAAIDATLDKTGGLPEDGKVAKLADMAGEGSALFAMDLPAIAKLAWPMLAQASQGEEFPLKSLPSADKMARMLGPEVAVFEPQDGGLLLKSRGKIPFATTFVLMPLPLSDSSFGRMLFIRMLLGNMVMFD